MKWLGHKQNDRLFFQQFTTHNMKRITQYQCEICKAIFDKRQQAIDCEANGAPIFDFANGEMVAVEHYGIFGKDYAGVKVIKQIVAKNTHEKGYELSDAVQTGNNCFIGTATNHWSDDNRDGYYVASESDLHKFYNIDKNLIEIYE